MFKYDMTEESCLGINNTSGEVLSLLQLEVCDYIILSC